MLVLMLILPIPTDLTISTNSQNSVLRRRSSLGEAIVPRGPFRIRCVAKNTEKLVVPSQLVIDLPKSATPHISQTVRTRLLAGAASALAQRRAGLSRGFRVRLRLVGVGFRATRTTVDGQAVTTSSENDLLRLTLGYSRERTIPLSDFSKQGRRISPSRLDGRTKGSLILLEGTNQSVLHRQAATLITLRSPDPYQGKGIHGLRASRPLKKGKREA
jgi:ribosomal protein L6P/L9E